MTIHIESLICHIAVTPSASSRGLADAGSESEVLLQRAQGDSASDTAENAEGSSPKIDLADLTSRVYRMMRDELELSRERE